MLLKWETSFLLIMTLPIMGHVISLPLMIDVAGRDSWIAVLISLPAAMAFAYAIYRIRLKYPKLYANELLTQILGKWIGRFYIFLFIIYFLFITTLSFATLVDFVQIGFLTDTPRLAIMIWFLIFFVYAALKGIKRIALTAGILTLIGMITGHLLTIMDTPKKDWGELLPILEYGWNPAIWGSLILISIWVEMLFLLFVPIKNIHEKRTFLLWLIAILIIALTMNSTTTGVVTIFGLGQADNFEYPAQEIVRIVNLGFIDRFDIYGMILMTFGNYIRCSLFFRIAYEMSTKSNSAKWKKRMMFSLFLIIVFFSAYYLTKDHFRIEYAINVYAYMIIWFPLPFILLFISMFKKKNTTVL